MHKKRLDTLSLLIAGFIKTKKISLTELARSMTLLIQDGIKIPFNNALSWVQSYAK